MQRRLPPLTSLRAFEAAGRHLSFTAAAAELGVTQAAISHQVKALEAYLGNPLFVRLPRKLELTPAAATLLPVLQDSFDAIRRTVDELMRDEEQASITVAVAPSFAARWLSPRLDDFMRRYPQFELDLKHSNGPVDFATQAIDVAVTYGRGDWPGVVCERILEIDFFPVCAPAYLQGSDALTEPDKLGRHTLLHDSDRRNWKAWLTLAGAGGVDGSRGPVVDDTNVLIKAAVDGIGIALGSMHFVRDHLEDGRLVRPFETTLTSEFAYYVVCPNAQLKRPKVHAFWSWLVAQAERDTEEAVA